MKETYSAKYKFTSFLLFFFSLVKLPNLSCMSKHILTCVHARLLSSTLSLRKSGEERGPAMSFMMFPALIVCAVEHGKRGKMTKIGEIPRKCLAKERSKEKSCREANSRMAFT